MIKKQPKKYTTILILAAIGLLGFVGYSLLRPAQLGINEVSFHSGAPATVIIQDGVYTDKGKWIPPGTYSCNLGAAGCTVYGQFFNSGTYGTKHVSTVEERQAIANYNNAIRAAAGAQNIGSKPSQAAPTATPASATNPAAAPSATPTPTPVADAPVAAKSYNPSDLNQDGTVNIQDYNIFIANYGRSSEEK